jgi:tRNA A-37 threonylcarbamoyl transferase component Bud32
VSGVSQTVCVGDSRGESILESIWRANTLYLKKIMNGGTAIATGSDGCVFDGTFAPNGTFTQTTDTVTKVYAPEYASVAANEYARMQEVKAATGGLGVVVATSPPVTIATIPDDAWGMTQVKRAHACGEVSTSSGPFTGLVLPRITGDLYRIRSRPLKLESFTNVLYAVKFLFTAGLVHMDFAARNLFYKQTGTDVEVLLGDFGTTINVNSPDFDRAIQTYVTRYGLRDKILRCAKIDGVDPLAIAMMIAYDTILQGSGAYTRFSLEVLTGRYYRRALQIAQATWIVRELELRSTNDGTLSVDKAGDDEVLAFTDDLAGEFQKMFVAYVPKATATYEDILRKKDILREALKDRLRKSDQRLLYVLASSYTMPVLDKERCRALRNLWFHSSPPAIAPPPVPAPVVRGGRRRTVGGANDLLFETLEEALAQPDLVLRGGRRKTYRTKRGRRVKMSRRR